MSQTELNFYNTNNTQGVDLLKSELSANKQGVRILIIMKEKGVAMTPFQVQDEYIKRHGSILITSIRRAISDLDACGLLVKTNETIIERYGKSNYLWKI
jgi:hypothetical protein